MVWTEKWKRLDEMSIRNAIYATNPKLRIGWMLSAYQTSDWQVCRIIGETKGVAHRIEKVRDCTAQEKEKLNMLLWTAQICMRHKPVERGNSWAFACLD